MIYIDKVFDKVLRTNLFITFLSFINDFRFFVKAGFVKEKVNVLDNIVVELLNSVVFHEISYNMYKTKAKNFRKF